MTSLATGHIVPEKQLGIKATQRNLNDKGKALARAFGDAIGQAGISVGKVYTSKYNRADCGHRGLKEYREDRRYYRRRSGGVAERK